MNAPTQTQARCLWCSGHGDMDCPACGGCGHNPEGFVCYWCSGAGAIECIACDGDRPAYVPVAAARHAARRATLDFHVLEWLTLGAIAACWAAVARLLVW